VSAKVLTSDSYGATMVAGVEPQNLLYRKEKIMSRKKYKINRGTGVHLVTHSRPTEKIEVCGVCEFGKPTKNYKEVFCTKKKIFKPVKSSRIFKCFVHKQ
jgi:hypothetical protein